MVTNIVALRIKDSQLKVRKGVFVDLTVKIIHDTGMIKYPLFIRNKKPLGYRENILSKRISA